MGNMKKEHIIKEIRSAQVNLLQGNYGNVRAILEELRIQLEEEK